MKKQICMMMPRIENIGNHVNKLWIKVDCPQCGDPCYDRSKIINKYSIKMCSKCAMTVKDKYKLI